MEKTPYMKSPFNLNGKVCVIIGGSGLIGSAFSRACAEHGARAIVAGIDKKRGPALAKEINENGGEAVFIEADTTNEVSVKRLVKEVMRRFKRVDALVNCAHFNTGSWGRPFTETAYGDFLTYIDKHIGGPFLATREFAKVMKKQKSGSIVFMSSIYGIHAPRFGIYEGTEMTVRAEYAAAKGALVQLMRYLAKALGPHGIRVNAISPGGVYDKQHPSFVKKYSKHAILGNRMANTDDLAPALVYLLSDASKYTTGQNIVIDGGWTL